jgi:hypothetical protein
MTEWARTPKQPWEFWPVTMDFSHNMSESETLIKVSSSVSAINNLTGDDVSDDVLSSDFSIVDQFKIRVILQGGLDGGEYRVSFKGFINDEKKLEEDLIFFVKDY